jgi:crotonobetainyl-CoA:carnitine CoA-transferase CaiB-like acyl-CoA transferase
VDGTQAMNDQQAGTQRASGPLSGIRVLDFSTIIAGPYGCTLLADLGASVTKVESPMGDPIRDYPSTLKGESRAYIGINRGKRSVIINLKRPEARRVLDRLVQGSDVLVHNFRPSVPARLALDWERLKQINPRLIHCSVSGFGEDGPFRDRPGLDQVLQAMTGMARLQGKPDGEPEIVWGSVVDYFTSSMLAYSVTAALLEREKTGVGQKVSVSLLQSALAMQSARLVWAAGEGRDTNRDFRSLGTTAIYPTAKGWLYITTSVDHFWRSFCEIAGLKELATDARYDTTLKRAERSQELIPQIAQALKARPAEEWEDLLSEHVPCAAVRGVEDVFDHPQVVAEELIATSPHPTLGSYRAIQSPVTLGNSPCQSPGAAPVPGAHSLAVLAEHDFTTAEINDLVATGAVFTQEESRRD